MVIKDWILLLVPIIFNGVIMTLLKHNFEIKLKIKHERRTLKQTVFNELLDLIESLNSSITDTMLVRHNPDISVELANINSCQIELHKYYLNKFSVLEDISKHYDKFIESWELFGKQAGLYTDNIRNDELDWAVCHKSRTLYELNNVKISVELLIKEVREYNLSHNYT